MSIFKYLITEVTKNNMKRSPQSIFTVFIVLLFSVSAKAQKDQPEGLVNYLKQCAYFLQDGGKWKALNKDFNPAEEWSTRYYGYVFSKGINDNTLHLKIMGYIPKKSEWLTFWNGYYTWDHKKQKVIYHSVNIEGAVASGESESITGSGISLAFSVTSPDGKTEKHRDVQKLAGNQILSSSYIRVADQWKLRNSMTWSRLEQPKGIITFMSTRDGNWETYTMDAQGENLKNLTCNKAVDYAFSYAPGGRLVFYSNRDGNDEIYIMEADGKKQTNLTNHPSGDRVACVSPDGKQIVFTSYRDEKNGELYVMDIDGNNVKRLTDNKYFEDAATWSPDGKKIYFSRELKDVNDTSVTVLPNLEIFVMDADGTNEIRLTNKPGGDGGPVLSPDGTKIAFYGSTAAGNYEIFLMDTDGKNIINLTEDPMEDYSPSWSPDGKWIAYTKGDSKNYDVWMIHLETGIKTRLTTQPRRDESPFWQR